MGSVIVLCGCLVVVVGLVLGWSEHSDAGVSAFGGVPAFPPFEDGVGKVGSCFPGAGVEDFELEGSPEGFPHGVVVAITDRAQGWERSGGAEALPEGPLTCVVCHGRSAGQCHPWWDGAGGSPYRARRGRVRCAGARRWTSR